jgi:prepilin-type N-terminal cleavage/methylation domain-containing protein
MIVKIGKKKKSFTMIELMIVVVIVGSLTSIAVPKYIRMKEATISKEAMANVKLISAAEQVYGMEIGGFYEASDVPTINSELNLAVGGNNWAYTTTDLGSGVVRTTAARSNYSGRFSGCVYQLDSNSATGEPVAVVAADCP